MNKTKLPALTGFIFLLVACGTPAKTKRDTAQSRSPRAVLTKTEPFYFNSFVDCNMAEAWIGDTFRIFPGKYGEDPLWGEARDLKFANGRNADEAFHRRAEEFQEPIMPKNAPVGTPGLHGAVWFETVYQDDKDASGKTLYALYHNENYPSTLPYNPATGIGYKDSLWPQGLKGPQSPAAVPRIGIMKSTNGGHSWQDKGIVLEDLQARMILKPHNTSNTFGGGVGDPSAIRSGDYLYIFYGEYGYPGEYNGSTYTPEREWQGQCISIARIALTDLDNPAGKAARWDGRSFSAPFNGIGKPVASLQIPMPQGGPASSPKGQFHWGPSVSWNTFLNCWVMLMGKVEGPSWVGGDIHISFNLNKDLGAGTASQEWTTPQLLLSKPGHTIWYPSLQPLATPEAVANKNTCLKLGEHARLFYKDNHDPSKTYVYISEYTVKFEK
jgi:hypothetical protein